MTTLTVNGESQSIKASPDTPLLYVLRDELGLNAAKYGCGLGQCGACTVIVDGKAIFSCVTPVMVLEGRTITTLEGLGGRTRLAQCSVLSSPSKPLNVVIAFPA